MKELLWGQYALFLCLRLQDDLLDGHRQDLKLLLVADHFLLESLRAFHHLPGLDDTFWRLYRRWVGDTVNGALEVERLQRKPGAFTRKHLGLYARVGCAFKVGTAALGRLHRRRREATWLSRFQDQVTTFGQIVDDLEDLVADVNQGRYTWVANTILVAKRGESIPPAARARRLGEGFLRPERGTAIVSQLRRIAHAMAAVVPASAPQPIHDLVQRLGATPDAIEESLHQARVRWVFRKATRAMGYALKRSRPRRRKPS